MRTVSGGFPGFYMVAAAPEGGALFCTNNSSKAGDADSTMRFSDGWQSQSAADSDNRWSAALGYLLRRRAWDLRA